MMPSPSAAHPPPSEFRFARGAGLAVTVVGVPALAGAAALRGAPGVLGAAVGLVLVFVLFGGSALVQAWATRFSNETLLAVVGFSLWFRLVLYVAVLAGVAMWTDVDLPTLAVVTAVGFVVTLGWEFFVIARTPTCFWLDAGRGSNTEGGSAS